MASKSVSITKETAFHPAGWGIDGVDAAITACEELCDMLAVLRAATKSGSPPSADAISTIAELSIKRASGIGSFLADLPHD